jgi:hypothetical protein
MLEAEKMWQAERTSDSAMTLAAMAYLSIAASMSGKENLGLSLVSECRIWAMRMNYFGVQPTNEMVLTFHQLSPDNIRQQSHVAWGVYAGVT